MDLLFEAMESSHRPFGLLRRQSGLRRSPVIPVVLLSLLCVGLGGTWAPPTYSSHSHPASGQFGVRPSTHGPRSSSIGPDFGRHGVVPRGGGPPPASNPPQGVASTLVLFNDTLVPGNFLAGNGFTPCAAAFDSGTQEVYVADCGSSTVSVISDVSDQVVATIAVPLSGWVWPSGLAYDGGRGQIWVAGPGVAEAISDTTDRVVASVAVGSSPSGIAYDSGDGDVFVTNVNSNNVSVISDNTDRVVDNISGFAYPDGVAYDSGRGELFVADSGSDSVSVVSDRTDSVIATVSVGSAPQAIVYDSGRGEVFVANYEGDPSAGVTVISDVTNTVVANVPGVQPIGLAYDGGRGEVFETIVGPAGSGVGQVDVISDTTNTQVEAIRLGEWTYPGAVTYDPRTSEVFVADPGADIANGGLNNVSVISDVNNRVVSTVRLGSQPSQLAYASGTGELFVVDSEADAISVVSGVTGKVVTTLTGFLVPEQPVYDFERGEVFVADAGKLDVISEATNRVVGEVPVSGNVFGMAYDPALGEVFAGIEAGVPGVAVVSDATDNVVTTVSLPTVPTYLAVDWRAGELFVACFNGLGTGGFSVTVISLATDRIVATIPWAGLPEGIVYDSGKGEVMVTTSENSNLTVISDVSNSVVGSIPLGGAGPSDVSGPLAYDSGNGEIFVSNPGSRTVTVVSDTSDAVVATVPVGSDPQGIAYDSGTGGIFVANQNQGTLSSLLLPNHLVTVTESGLAAGTPWRLDAGNGTYGSMTSSITFAEANGQYRFGVIPVAGYNATPANGTFAVEGADQNLSIVFTHLASPTQSGFLGMPGIDGYVLLGTVVAAAVIVAVVVRSRWRPRSPPSTPGPPVP